MIARHVMERERLAAKIRLLARAAYRRGEARQLLRDLGIEVPTAAGSWDSYDDYIFSTFKPKVDSLAGQGQEGSGPDTRRSSGAGTCCGPSTAPSHLSVFRTLKPRVDGLTGEGQGVSGLARRNPPTTTGTSHLSVLPGGGEDTRPGAAAGGRSGQLRHGDQTLRVAGVQPGAHPNHFDTEETK